MIVGQMALTGRFPLWEKCLRDLAEHCDRLYVRFDTRVGDRRVLKAVPEILGPKMGSTLSSDTPWDNWQWREEMLRSLDIVKPDLVLTCDEDEMFEPKIKQDLVRLGRFGGQMAFGYVNPTEDDWVPPKPYPSKPHVKAYAWKPGLTFRNYQSRGRLSNYRKNQYLLGQARIQHYCFYTPQLRTAKAVTKSTEGKMRWAQEATTV